MLREERCLSDVERAYLAGFFDADGWVDITHSGSNPQGALLVNFGNTNLDVLKWIHERIGGSLNLRVKGTDTRRPFYGVQVASRQALRVLKAIEPFCIVKKERVKIAIAFQRTFKKRVHRGVPLVTRLKRQALEKRLRELNQRGV